MESVNNNPNISSIPTSDVSAAQAAQMNNQANKEALAADSIMSLNTEKGEFTLDFKKAILSSGVPIDPSESLFTGDEVSLVTLIQALSMMLAKSTGAVWKANFDAQMQTMKFTLDMAPKMAEATLEQGQAEAKQIREAGMSKLIQGCVSVGMAVASAGMGYASVSSEVNAAKNAATGVKATQESAQQAAQGANAINQGAQSTTEAVKTATDALSKAQSFGNIMDKVSRAAQLLQGLSAGINGGIEYHFSMKQADARENASQWEAHGKQLDISLSFFQQAASKMGDAVQGDQQSFDQIINAMNQSREEIMSAIKAGFQRI
jgi:hypothetical protein